MRGCGVSVYRVVLTAVMLSLVVTGLTFVFTEHIAPAANYQAAITLERAIKSEKPSVKKDNFIYPETGEMKDKDGKNRKILTRLYYADQFDGRRFNGLTIIDRSREGPNQIVVAEAAEWNVSQNTWDVFNGTIYVVAPDRSYRNIAQFKHYQMQLPRTAFNLAEQTRDYDQMNISQALEQLEIERLGGDRQKIRKLEVRIQQKIAFPFICVIFGLVGSVMGTIPQRTGRGTSFGISVVVIFTYYLLLSISGALAQAGILSPFIGAWLPNFFGLATGVFLLIRIAQR